MYILTNLSQSASEAGTFTAPASAVDYGLDHNNSILSDRTFLVNALKIMKANAILNGRDRCIMEDLYCLNMLTTFRVPMEVHEQIDDVIKQAILAEEDDNNSDGNDGTPPSSHGATDGDSDKNKEFRKSRMIMQN